MEIDKLSSNSNKSGLDGFGSAKEDSLSSTGRIRTPAEARAIHPDPDLSHDVRTQLAILTLVSGNLDILYDRLDDEKRRQMVRDIRKHTRMLSDLAADMLSRL